MARGTGSRGSRWRTRLNSGVAVLLVALLLIVPLPFASVEPLAWCAYAMVLSLTMLGYLALLAARGLEPSVPLGSFGIEALLWTLLCLYVLVQRLPLGGFVPPAPTRSGATIEAAQISLAPGSTLLVFVLFASYGLLFFLARQVTARESRLRFWLIAITVIVAIYAAYALVALTQLDDTILGLPKWQQLGSATSTFINRNNLATFLSLGAVTGLAVLLADPDTGKAPVGLGLRIAVIGCLVLILAALFASQSRMGTASGLAGIATVGVLRLARRPASRRLVLLTILVTTIAAGAVLWTYGGGLIERLGSVEGDYTVRANLYAQVAEMIRARPWLGFGAGSFEFTYPLFHHAPVSADLLWDRAHSTYLSNWAEYGVIAGTLPMLVIATIFMRAALRLSRSDSLRVGDLVVIGAVVVTALHSLLDFSLEIPGVAYVFVALLAAGGPLSVTKRASVPPAPVVLR